MANDMHTSNLVCHTPEAIFSNLTTTECYNMLLKNARVQWHVYSAGACMVQGK